MRQRFATSQWVPYTVEVVFAFFANPNNLPLLMPEGMKMRIDGLNLVPAPPHPTIASSQFAQQEIAAGEGTEMKISFRPLPYLPVRASWVARISEFVWLSHFCDEQVRGPFALFRHRHGVQAETQDGRVGTTVTDQVEFELPLGSVGRLGDGIMRRQMEQMFRMRQERLPGLLKTRVRRDS